MSEKVEKILILGGTKEAAELASSFYNQGHIVITSLAGRTKEPTPLAGETRIGGFGGAEGLAGYLVKERFDRLIDATHPFAVQISQNAIKASKISNVPLEIKTREHWKKVDGDQWIDVPDLHSACMAPPKNARILLALGSQYIESFKVRDDVYYLVRMVDRPNTPLPLPNHDIVIGKPYADWQKEAELLKENRISHIICRNSGGIGAYAKIQAARNLGIPVIMIARA